MIDATCQWDECDSVKIVARGLCDRDYRRAKRAGRLTDFKADDRKCIVCGQDFPIDKHRKACCSPQCSQARSGTLFKRARIEALPDRDCRLCLEPIPTSLRRDATFCSAACQQTQWYLDNAETLRKRTAEWNRANDGKRRTYRHARRARMYAVAYEIFDVWEIAERDRWLCGICGEPVNRDLTYPHPLSKSLDHIVPLSRGGSHTRANAAVAHLLCNTKKKDRLARPDRGVTSPSAVAS